MRKRPNQPAVFAQQAGGIPDGSGATGSLVLRHTTSPWSLILFCGLTMVYLALFFRAALPRFQGPAERSPTRLDLQWTLISSPMEIVGSWGGASSAGPALLDRTPVWAVSAAILTAGWAAGSLFLRALGVSRDLSRWEQFVFSLGGGLSLVSLYTLAAGLAGWLHTPALFWGPMLVVTGAAAVCQWHDRQRAARDPGAPTRQPPAPATWFARYGLWFASPFAVALVLGGVLPAWEFDVREYHLQIPKEWHAAGRIDFVPHNVYGNMPLGAEMHALLGMVLMPGDAGWWWGALVGKTIIACYALLTGLALYAASRRFVSAEAGVVAAIVYLSIPWVAYVSMAGLVDAVWGCYLFLAVYASLIGASLNAKSSGLPSGRTRWVCVAGWLAGSAAACKYPAVVLVVLPLLGYVALSGRPRCSGRQLTAFVLAAAVAGGLWFGKNALLTGNPTYPLLYRALGGRTRTADKDRQWSRAHAIPNYSVPDLSQRLNELFLNGDWNSPVLWPLAALSVLAIKTCRPARAVLALLAVYLAVWWLTTHRIPRFWVPALPLAAFLAGCGATWNLNRWWRLAAQSLVVLGVLLTLPWVCSPLIGDSRFLTSLEALRSGAVAPIEGLSAREIAFRYLNVHVPPGSRVLLVGEAQPFDLRPDAIYNTCFDDCQLERLIGGRSPSARRAAFHESRISHVLIHWAELDRYRAPGNYGYPAFVTRSLVHDELVRDQQLLRRIEVNIPAHIAELYEVVP